MAWIYRNNANNSARFALGEYNNITAKTLICVGINPSTATPNNLDPTLKRVKAISNSNKYVNWIMINVYPQRATKPKTLPLGIDAKIHNRNINEIKNVLTTFNNADIFFAYGNSINIRPYLYKCLSDILTLIDNIKFSGQLYCVKRTKKGNPFHPLCLKKDSSFIPY